MPRRSITRRARAGAALCAVVLGIVPSGAGCALFASANAAHSHITPCVDDPAFSVIDLVLGSGIGVALVASDTINQSPAWLLVPGAFLASGVIGSITSYQCRHPDNTSASSSTSSTSSTDSTSSTGNTSFESGSTAPVDPPLPAATPADLGLPAPDPTVPAARLQLPADYVLPDPPKPASDRIACTLDPPTPCPPKQSCLIGADNQGTCVPDP